jgi:hypothetical protein
MPTLENIHNIFSIFHDGYIEKASGNMQELTLQVSCLYLAERIDFAFEYFYIELCDISTLSLHVFSNETPKILTDIKAIFETEWDIVDTKIEHNNVVIFLEQYNKNSPAILTLNCADIKVFDHKKNAITLDNLIHICKVYWDDFGKK